jgi:hypothetical protein
MQLKYWYLTFYSVCALSCNQKLYDQLWLTALTTNFQMNLIKVKAINEHDQYTVDYTDDQKVDTKMLKVLCNGQRSKYETNK